VPAKTCPFWLADLSSRSQFGPISVPNTVQISSAMNSRRPDQHRPESAAARKPEVAGSVELGVQCSSSTRGGLHMQTVSDVTIGLLLTY